MENENNNQKEKPEKTEKKEFNMKNGSPIKIYSLPQKIESSSDEISSDKNIETDEERNSSSNNNTPSHKNILIKSQLINEPQKQKNIKPTKKMSNNITIKDLRIKKKFEKEEESNEESFSEKETEIKEKRKIVEKSPQGRFYHFNEKIGSGAQKTVYIAYDSDEGREVAWNAINLNSNLSNNEEALKTIKNEIEILKLVHHPNILSFIYGFYLQEKKEIVVITELINGGSLKAYLNIYKYPRLRVIKLWCQEILKGLKYLHEFNPPIIHRDIKCDNILINKATGEVKIGDLGFSRMLKSSEYAKTFSGTVEFCSPEVYQGKYTVKADIYSFGMTMLEMVTREKPYKECDGNILSICDKVVKKIYPLCMNKIRNEKLKNFIKECLKPENERPNASDLLQNEFLNDLESEENNYPALAYPLIKNESDDNKEKNSINNNIKSPSKNNPFARIKSNNIQTNNNITNNTNSNIINITSNNNNTNNNNTNNTNTNNTNTNNTNTNNTNNNTKFNTNTNTNNNNNNLEKKKNENEVKQRVIKYHSTSNKDQTEKEKKDNKQPIINIAKSTSSITNNLNNIQNEINIKLDEEEKSNENIAKIILMKKNKGKTLKIKFDFIFNTDTIEGVTNELQRVISLSEKERKDFENKLKTLLDNLKISLTQQKELESHRKEIEENYSKFKDEYDKCIKEAENLLSIYKGNINKEIQNIKQSELDEFEKKISILEEFVKGNI